MGQHVRRIGVTVFALLIAGSIHAGALPRRRALLIGVNDYSASRLPRRVAAGVPPPRDWVNLTGALNDVAAMRDALIELHAFDARDVATLTDQRATRAAILGALEALIRKAAKGDLVLFYFSGHGSRVLNSRSDEPDKLDESLVPADSRLGVRDIHDKELRAMFNRILDKGAQLRIVLDACFSGSAFRGLATPDMARGIRADLRDVADGPSTAPKPEERGAVVVAASQDHELAFEFTDEEGKRRGAFSWAWVHAMRDAAPGEPAIDTFLRASARLGAMARPQHAVFAGNDRARQQPFIDSGPQDVRHSPVVAVARVRRDGTVVIHGGWLNGLTVGSELRLLGRKAPNVRIEVKALDGLARCEGRASDPRRVKAGSLLEIVSWAAPPAHGMRIWIPRAPSTAAELAALAQTLAADASRRGITWIEDPVEKTPTHLLRWNGSQWELIEPKAPIRRWTDPAAALASIPRNAALFVQWPLPDATSQRILLGPGTQHSAVERVGDAVNAAYVLAGRATNRGIEYAWVRPFAVAGSPDVLPPRTNWEPAQSPTTPYALTEAVLRLQRIRAWQLVDSPASAEYPYGLVLRQEAKRELVRDAVLTAGEPYHLALRATARPMPPRVAPRYVYVFVIDSFGRSTLLFPRNAAVENWFPLPSTGPPPAEIAPDGQRTFHAAEPYGIDTYALLSTDEPLPNPWILEWDGVRTRTGDATTPLEELLVSIGSPERSVVLERLPVRWSLQRLVFRSIAPDAKRTAP
ncbi:MAG: hypothetical protein DMF56_19285 [Acidobacteria bacterium]|nr:MAG: hypothetical protein DMF56_19285 [Acidobacteriota bacterium]